MLLHRPTVGVGEGTVELEAPGVQVAQAEKAESPHLALPRVSFAQCPCCVKRARENRSIPPQHLKDKAPMAYLQQAVLLHFTIKMEQSSPEP